jgi:hypothetical protein
MLAAYGWQLLIIRQGLRWIEAQREIGSRSFGPIAQKKCANPQKISKILGETKCIFLFHRPRSTLFYGIASGLGPACVFGLRPNMYVSCLSFNQFDHAKYQNDWTAYPYHQIRPFPVCGCPGPDAGSNQIREVGPLGADFHLSGIVGGSPSNASQYQCVANRKSPARRAKPTTAP